MRRIVGISFSVLMLLTVLSYAYAYSNNEKEIQIDRPIVGKAYINDFQVPFVKGKIIVIGPLTVKVTVDHCIGCAVKFILDNRTILMDTHRPYVCRINERLMGHHVVKVKLYMLHGGRPSYIGKEKSVNVTFINPVPRLFEFKGKLVGTVVNASSGKKIKDANITIISVNYNDDPSNSTTMNLSTGKIPLLNLGKFRVKLKPGTYIIRISSQKYVSKRLYVDIRSMSKTTVRIELQRRIC